MTINGIGGNSPYHRRLHIKDSDFQEPHLGEKPMQNFPISDQEIAERFPSIESVESQSQVLVETLISSMEKLRFACKKILLELYTEHVEQQNKQYNSITKDS